MPAPPTIALSDAAGAARLRRIVLYLRRKWWIPVLLMLLVGAGQAAWLLLRPRSFTAVGRMWVGGKVRLAESSFFSEDWQNFFGTQIELMQGEKIRRRALARIRSQATTTNLQPLKIEVSQPRKTTIFNLSARGPDAAYLEAYLNAVMDEYLKYKREVRATSSDDTVASLAEQVEKVERDLKAEQEQLTSFQRSNNITVLKEFSVSAGNQLNKLNLQLADLKLEAKLLALVSPEEHLEKNAGDLVQAMARRLSDVALSSTLPPADYFTARQQLELKKVEQKDLGERLKPEHPAMIKLSEEISRLAALVEIYGEQSREKLDNTRETLRLKIQAVDDAIKNWEPRVVDSNERLAQYERSKMSLDRVLAMHTRLLQAMHNVDVNKSVDQESVSVMDRAFVLPTPLRLPFKVVLSSAVGFIMGLGIVLFIEQTDKRILTPTELRLSMPVRLLGCVPDASLRRSKKQRILLTPDDRRHRLVESFRNLRASLLAVKQDGRRPQTILVTSAAPEEGKSTIAANLALVLAFSGSRVLLVDGDVRRGRLHEILDLKSEPGLTDLMGSTRPPEEFLQATATPNLSFLPSGGATVGAGELFAQDRFDRLLEMARGRFDCILIDTSPVLAASDSCTLAPKVDGVLFVVRARSTALPLTRQAVELLQEHRAPLLGLIFNRVDASSGDYPFHKYEGYALPPDRPALTPPSVGAMS